jgi:biopolymer transport protein TolR
MGDKSGARTDGPMAEINITPFTDVLLVLLIIFMILAALTTPAGFQKKLQQSCPSCAISPAHTKDIEISVAASGAIVVDGERVNSSHLYDRIADAIRNHTGQPGLSTHISLTAESAAPYDSIVKVLDASREAGDDDVGLIAP